MVDNIDLNQAVFNLLTSYVNKKFKSESFFVSITGCNSDLLDLVQKNADCTSQNNDVRIVALYAQRMNFSFDKLVKMRNDSTIKKILVFTNASLNTIDSLKDFTHIYYSDLSYEVLWPILIDMFLRNISKCQEETSDIKSFIFDVISEIRPELPDLVAYLKASDSDYEKYGNAFFALNCNLNILGVWSSSEEACLSKNTLKRIVANSIPSAIQKKLTTPRDIRKITTPKISDMSRLRYTNLTSQKGLLREMFYNREYTEAFRGIAYEQMKTILKYNSRQNTKGNDISGDDHFYPYENIYNMYLMELAGSEFISVNEDQIIAAEKDISLRSEEKDDDDNNNTEFEQVITFQFNEAGKLQSKSTSVNFKKAVEKIEHFKKHFQQPDAKQEQNLLVRCNELNITPSDVNILQRSLGAYLQEREKFINKLSQNGIEGMLRLHKVLEESNTVRQSFLQLLKDLYAFDENTIKNIASVGFLNEIIELDLVLSEDKENLYLPIYSPAILFYLQIVQNRYKECLQDIQNMNTSILATLESINLNIFNDYAKYSGNLYQLSDTRDFPYLLCYEANEILDSIKKIDFKIVRNALTHYIQQYPYKHQLKLCILGEIDAKSLKSCLKGILDSCTETNLEKFQLIIISKAQKNVRELFSSLFERDDHLYKNIECRVVAMNILDVNNVEDMIRDNDVVVFLDSCALYHKPVFRPSKVVDVESTIHYREYETEKAALPVAGQQTSLPVVPYAINALINASTSGKLQDGEWSRHELDMMLFDKINSTISAQKQQDKIVVMVLSDCNADNQILNNQNVLSISEDVMTGEDKNAKIIVFQKFGEENIDTFDTNMQTPKDSMREEDNLIKIPFLELCNALRYDIKNLLSDGYVELLSKIFLYVCYSKFPHEINITSNFTFQNENGEWDSFYNQYLKRAFTPHYYLDEHYKRIMVALLMQNAKDKNDILFVHYFTQIDCSKVTSKDSSQPEYMKIPITSLHKNYLFRILSFLDTEALSERTTKDFKKLCESSHTNEDDLTQLLEIAKNANYSDDGHLINNLLQLLKDVT